MERVWQLLSYMLAPTATRLSDTFTFYLNQGAMLTSGNFLSLIIKFLSLVIKFCHCLSLFVIEYLDLSFIIMICHRFIMICH